MKDALPFVVAGHIDHGKSTLIGRLLFETGSLPKSVVDEIKKVSRELGTEAEVAFLTDQLREERERNITIDTAQIRFRSRQREYVIIDAPGHVEFTRNMITGASQAQLAVLVVDVTRGAEEQTRRHAYLLDFLGIGDVIVVINKMDKVSYSQEAFSLARSQVDVALSRLSLRVIDTIACSAFKGEGVARRSKKMRWSKRSLLDALEAFQPARGYQKEIGELPVQDIYERNGQRLAIGQVARGALRKGEKVGILPTNEQAVIRGIHIMNGELKRAEQEENVALDLGNVAIARGDVIAGEGSPLQTGQEISMNLFWMAESELREGANLALRLATQKVSGRVSQINNLVDTASLAALPGVARSQQQHQAATVTFKVDSPLVYQPYPVNTAFGRAVIEKNLEIQGAGLVL